MLKRMSFPCPATGVLALLQFWGARARSGSFHLLFKVGTQRIASRLGVQNCFLKRRRKAPSNSKLEDRGSLAFRCSAHPTPGP